MAIQMRRGDYADFDPDMMSAGEFAVVKSGDTTTRTGKSVRICFAPGDVQRLSTVEEMEADVEHAVEESETIHDLVKDTAEELMEEHPEWRATVPDGSITTAKLADGAVTSAKLASNAVTEGKIASSAVTEGKIASGAVTSGKIGSSAVTEAKIASGAVTSGKIGSSAVTNVKLADNAVTSVKIGDSAVTTAKINDEAVTDVKLAENAVVTSRINDNAVTLAKLASEVLQKFYIYPGDTISLNGKIFVGFLTGGATTVRFSIPVFKEISGVNNIAVSGQCEVRHSDGAYIGGGLVQITSLGTVACQYYDKTVQVVVTLPSAVSLSNNAPVSVVFYSTGVLTFS